MLCRRILLKNHKPYLQTLFRTFLSKEYKCPLEWESRLTSPLMQKIKIDTLYYEIDQAFNQNGKASAIDIDIFVNKVNDDIHIDEMVDLIHRLRRTEETSNSLESTGHAVCRNFIEYNHIDDLLQILDNPLEYGVFLDNYIANLIMDECIKRENFLAAARIATFQMLQENFDNELTRYLSLYSCLKYLSSNPQPFYPPKEEKDDDTEVVKVRVKYIRNEFFDDHFDLKNHFHLVGKTLAMIGANMKEEGGIAKSSELLGHVLYQKYDKAINTLKSSPSNNFYKNIIEQCITHLDSNPSDEKFTELHNEIHSLLNTTLTKTDLIQNNLLDDIEKLLKESITKNEINEIEKQKEIYKMWNEIRLKRFNDEVKRIQKEQRIKNIEKLLNDMKDEEQKLWFFENEEKINLQIENRKKEQEISEKIIDVKKKTKDDDENYVPPEVIKHRK